MKEKKKTKQFDGIAKINIYLCNHKLFIINKSNN